MMILSCRGLQFLGSGNDPGTSERGLIFTISKVGGPWDSASDLDDLPP